MNTKLTALALCTLGNVALTMWAYHNAMECEKVDVLALDKLIEKNTENIETLDADLSQLMNNHNVVAGQVEEHDNRITELASDIRSLSSKITKTDKDVEEEAKTGAKLMDFEMRIHELEKRLERVLDQMGTARTTGATNPAGVPSEMIMP